MHFENRVTEMLGIEIPIVQAPMGWIARSQLASAVSNAGAMGIIETSSSELDAVKEEIRGPGLRALRTKRSEGLEYAEENVMGEFGRARDLYFGGDMNAAIALTGQVAGRIDAVRPVADIVRETAKEFFEVLGGLADAYLRDPR
jgi:enoyl-[acyl-carrier protein] reductase II